MALAPAGEDRPAVDVSMLVLRVVVGAIFAVHGGQKLFGWFGGKGLQAAVESMGMLAYPVAVGECLGGIGIILGFLTRFSAASNIVIMIGAIVMVHGKNGFLLFDTSGTPLYGYEYNLALIGLLFPIFLIGPGRYAIGPFLPLPRAAGSRRPALVLE